MVRRDFVSPRTAPSKQPDFSALNWLLGTDSGGPTGTRRSCGRMGEGGPIAESDPVPSIPDLVAGLNQSPNPAA